MDINKLNLEEKKHLASTTTEEKIQEELLGIKEVWAALASNPNLSDKFINEFIKTINKSTDDIIISRVKKFLLLKHPESETLWKLLLKEDTKVNVSNYIARHENIPKSIIKDIIEHENVSVRKELAANPKISKDTMTLLLKDSDVEVLKSLALNHNADPKILKQLAENSNTLIRAFVAKNINTPESILKILSEDIESSVREQVASNIKTPESVLKNLTKDKSPSVLWNLTERSIIPESVILLLLKSSLPGIKENILKNRNLSEKVYKELSNYTSNQHNLKSDSHSFKNKHVTYQEYKNDELFTKEQLVIKLEDFKLKDKVKTEAQKNILTYIRSKGIKTGHPTSVHTLGWARIEDLKTPTGERIWIIVEIQSDIAPVIRDFYYRVGKMEGKFARILKIANSLQEVIESIDKGKEFENKVKEVESSPNKHKLLNNLQKQFKLNKEQMSSLFEYFFGKKEKTVNAPKNTIKAPKVNFNADTNNADAKRSYEFLINEYGQNEVHLVAKQLYEMSKNIYHDIFDLVLEKAKENNILEVYLITPELLSKISDLKIKEQGKAKLIYEELPTTKGFIHKIPLNQLIKKLDAKLIDRFDNKGNKLKWDKKAPLYKYDSSAKLAFRLLKISCRAGV